jgi:hypothetical protein
MRRALCVWLENQQHKWLTISGTVVREKAMPVKAGMRIYLVQIKINVTTV